VHCGSGTYIRTLADDIASALGGRAHLTSLRRTGIGSLRVEDATTIEGLEAAAAAGEIEAGILSPSDGLSDLPAVRVDEETAVAVGHGSIFPAAALGISGHGHRRILGEDESLLAVYRSDGRRAVPEVVLA
jgi:tRNA pseudouridine55 synthase